MNNEQLLQEARNGDPAALDKLMRRFKKMVSIVAGAYYIVGGDRDDIVQEGMIGLFKAVRDYDAGKGFTFYAFARVCVSRQIMSAIKASARLKHQPLNNSLSLDAPPEPDLIIQSRGGDPERLLISREENHDFNSFLHRHLSALEYEVLLLYLQGVRPADIARAVDKNMKSVDNTLQRVRKKIGKIVQEKAKIG